MEKIICIFPYINLSKNLIMDDFEIFSYDNYDFSKDLNEEEKNNLDSYVESFRETFFQKWKSPKKINGVGILKYKWTIIRKKENSKDIGDKIKILYMILTLHINYDFLNPWISQIHFKTFDAFWCNVKSTYTNKFGSVRDYNNLYSTIPENINWLKDVKIYPLHYSINNIDSSIKMVGNFEDILEIDREKIDITYLYKWIVKDNDYYQKFLNLSSIHYWLEQQNDLFFYNSIIPSILEVLLYPINGKKKKTVVEFGEKLDTILVKDNVFIKTSSSNIEKERWIIARTFSLIYDLRNNLLHKGKQSFDKLKVEFKWYHLRIYDVFQLIFKFLILHDFIEKWIIDNKFIKLTIEWSIFTTWYINIWRTIHILYMDEQLNNLLNKAEDEIKYGS